MATRIPRQIIPDHDPTLIPTHEEDAFIRGLGLRRGATSLYMILGTWYVPRDLKQSLLYNNTAVRERTVRGILMDGDNKRICVAAININSSGPNLYSLCQPDMAALQRQPALLRMLPLLVVSPALHRSRQPASFHRHCNRYPDGWG